MVFSVGAVEHELHTLLDQVFCAIHARRMSDEYTVSLRQIELNLRMPTAAATFDSGALVVLVAVGCFISDLPLNSDRQCPDEFPLAHGVPGSHQG